MSCFIVFYCDCLRFFNMILGLKQCMNFGAKLAFVRVVVFCHSVLSFKVEILENQWHGGLMEYSVWILRAWNLIISQSCNGFFFTSTPQPSSKAVAGCDSSIHELWRWRRGEPESFQAFRPGQTKETKIYRLFAAETWELTILSAQQHKLEIPKKLADKVQLNNVNPLDSCIFYIHTYMHACMHAYIHTYRHTYIHTYIHACTHRCVYVYVYIYIYVCIHIYVYVYVCIYICVCIYVYVCIYICRYIYICIYIYM